MSHGKNNAPFQRFEANITLAGGSSQRKELVATLLGRRGANLRRIIDAVGNKAFIRIFSSELGKDARAIQQSSARHLPAR